MKPGDSVKLTAKAVLADVYPPSMKGIMLLNTYTQRDHELYTFVDVLCEDNQIRIANLADLEVAVAKD